MQTDKQSFLAQKEKQWDQTQYATWFETGRGKIIDRLEKQALAQALDGHHYDNVLEFGIGNGRLLEVYAPHSGQVVGTDISAVQLAEAAKAARNLGVRFTGVPGKEFAELRLEPASFDLVICSRVLQHLYEWREAIANFASVLKPGGDLALITYNRCCIYGLKKLYEHKFVNPAKGRFHTPFQIMGELKKNGLEVEYWSGALLGQPELFDEDLPPWQAKAIFALEKLAKAPVLKHLSGRHVVRARKR